MNKNKPRNYAVLIPGATGAHYKGGKCIKLISPWEMREKVWRANHTPVRKQGRSFPNWLNQTLNKLKNL